MSTVTVVIPTIPGREELLERALQSVSTQRRPPNKVVVENDVFRTGAAATRNRAIEKVETDYIAFLDDDDYFLETHIRTLMREAETRPDVDLIYPIPMFNNLRDGTAVRVDGRWVKPWGLPWSRDHEVHMLYRGNFIPICFLVKTRVVREVGGFPIPGTPQWQASNGEDWGMLRNLVKERAKFHHVPEMTWVWCGHDGHTSGMGESRG